MAALLDAARDQQVAVDAEQILAVEAGLLTSLSEPTGSASLTAIHVSGSGAGLVGLVELLTASREAVPGLAGVLV